MYKDYTIIVLVVVVKHMFIFTGSNILVISLKIKAHFNLFTKVNYYVWYEFVKVNLYKSKLTLVTILKTTTLILTLI